MTELLLRREEQLTPDQGVRDDKLRVAHMFPSVRRKEEAERSARAAIEAFFG
jgi:hypothetical protein